MAVDVAAPPRYWSSLAVTSTAMCGLSLHSRNGSAARQETRDEQHNGYNKQHVDERTDRIRAYNAE
jgi:hypothetical protein